MNVHKRLQHPDLMLIILLATLLLPCLSGRAWSTESNPTELTAARTWCAEHLGGEVESLPFSFTFDGKPSAELLADWSLERTTRVLGARGDRQTLQADRGTASTATAGQGPHGRGPGLLHVLRYVDPQSKFEVRCEVVEYRDFPTVEWTLYFRNTAAAASPIVAGIQALDATWQRGPEVEEFLLHHAVGSPADGSDYGPLETPLGPGARKRIAAAGGRPTNSDFSYFNLQWGRQGLIMAVGWPGQWAATFARDNGNSVHLCAGQEQTHFRLLPGEEVRSPLVVLQFWTGDWVRSQNLWRRWMMAHSMPRPGGQLPSPQLLASSSRAYKEMIGANEANQIMHIDRYLAEGLKLDYWWMDAGWYIQQTGWPQVGTWEIDPKRFPHGLRPISDHAHSKGLKILVWFEPERVMPGTWLYKNHPEWLLRVGASDKEGARLLNLGNSAARGWLTEHIDKLLTDEGIDLYRQDFNIDPLAFWRAADAPDRQGITEIKYVTGLLAYWDELRRRHPNMLIDSCASGGRRNDLETMRRAVPLWRSDYAYKSVGQQCMTYGISLWLPFYGTGTVATTGAPYYGGGRTKVEPYVFWSNAAPSLVLGIDVRERDLDYATLRRLCRQWRDISSCYYGDYYPLTPYHRDNKTWIAWQFDLPEQGKGVVQAFRRGENLEATARVRLRGVEPQGRYVLMQLDGKASEHAVELTGSSLREDGLPITIANRPGCAVITYARVSRKER